MHILIFIFKDCAKSDVSVVLVNELDSVSSYEFACRMCFGLYASVHNEGMGVHLKFIHSTCIY